MKKIEGDAIFLGRFKILKSITFLFLIVVEKSPIRPIRALLRLERTMNLL